MMKNPAQLAKDIHSVVKVTKPAVSVLKTVKSGSAKNTKIAELNNGAIKHLLKGIKGHSGKPVTVYLLARFRFQLPSQADISALQQEFSALHFECDTFHGSKGKEADYFIKLRQLSIGYTFPEKAFEKMPVLKGVNISLVARNLFFLMRKADNIDPESNFGSTISYTGIEGTSLPSTRSIGMNINFKLN